MKGKITAIDISGKGEVTLTVELDFGMPNLDSMEGVRERIKYRKSSAYKSKLGRVVKDMEKVHLGEVEMTYVEGGKMEG